MKRKHTKNTQNAITLRSTAFRVREREREDHKRLIRMNIEWPKTKLWAIRAHDLRALLCTWALSRRLWSLRMIFWGILASTATDNNGTKNEPPHFLSAWKLLFSLFDIFPISKVTWLEWSIYRNISHSSDQRLWNQVSQVVGLCEKSHLFQ